MITIKDKACIKCGGSAKYAMILTTEDACGTAYGLCQEHTLELEKWLENDLIIPLGITNPDIVKIQWAKK